MKQAIWLSYDLGVRGDYEGLFAWLDKWGAKDCGGNLAMLSYEFSGDSLTEALERDMRNSFEVDRNTRIYAVYRDREHDKVKGTFVIGRRKSPPWLGSAPGVGSNDVDEA